MQVLRRSILVSLTDLGRLAGGTSFKRSKYKRKFGDYSEIGDYGVTHRQRKVLGVGEVTDTMKYTAVC